MQNGKRGEAIRLTNKTAIALRRSANKEQTAHMAAAVVLTLLLAALAVYLGLTWLWAVPVTVACAVALDAVILIRARSRYLLLTGQAICTEAAARSMREERREQRRRERAISDLADMKADAQRALDASLEAKRVGQDTRSMPALGKKTAEQRADDAVQEKNAQIAKPGVQANATGAAEARPEHRRRRQSGFQVLRNEQAK